MSVLLTQRGDRLLSNDNKHFMAFARVAPVARWNNRSLEIFKQRTVLNAHISDFQGASAYHRFVVRLDLCEILVEKAVHLTFRGSLLVHEQDMNVFEQGSLHCRVPGLGDSAWHCRHRLPVLVDERYDLTILAEHHTSPTLFHTGLLQVGHGRDTHLRELCNSHQQQTSHHRSPTYSHSNCSITYVLGFSWNSPVLSVNNFYKEKSNCLEMELISLTDSRYMTHGTIYYSSHTATPLCWGYGLCHWKQTICKEK